MTRLGTVWPAVKLRLDAFGCAFAGGPDGQIAARGRLVDGDVEHHRIDAGAGTPLSGTPVTTSVDRLAFADLAPGGGADAVAGVEQSERAHRQQPVVPVSRK